MNSSASIQIVRQLLETTNPSLPESLTNPSFRKCFGNLPRSAQEQIRRAYHRWRSGYSANVQPLAHGQAKARNFWKAEIGQHWRALGWQDPEGTILWYWVGSHEDYNAEYLKCLSRGNWRPLADALSEPEQGPDDLGLSAREIITYFGPFDTHGLIQFLKNNVDLDAEYEVFYRSAGSRNNEWIQMEITKYRVANTGDRLPEDIIRNDIECVKRGVFKYANLTGFYVPEIGQGRHRDAHRYWIDFHVTAKIHGPIVKKRGRNWRHVQEDEDFDPHTDVDRLLHDWQDKLTYAQLDRDGYWTDVYDKASRTKIARVHQKEDGYQIVSAIGQQRGYPDLYPSTEDVYSAVWRHWLRIRSLKPHRKFDRES